MSLLREYYQVRRRYGRSVNLDRDLGHAETLSGYVPTPRVLDLVGRAVAALGSPEAANAWLLTGAYGTGKSAFGHFLAALHAPARAPEREAALCLLRSAGEAELADRISLAVPATGLVRVVAMGRREPIAHTILRALVAGAVRFWAGRRPPHGKVYARVQSLAAELDAGGAPHIADLPELVAGIAAASGAGLLLVIDELGKNLEAAALRSGAQDVFLLQQLAELPRSAQAPILTVGLLHHAFADYADGADSARRSEWDKIQGRFENVPFAEAAEQMVRLMECAIAAAPTPAFGARVAEGARAWERLLLEHAPEPFLADLLPAARIEALYPLHPVAGAALPDLCTRYAQNERSLFSFLASAEPHSLTRFLAEREADPAAPPVLRLTDLYDYFLETAGAGMYARPQFHRWAEIHGRIRDAEGLEPEEVEVLKTIGALNLISSSGPLRARKGLVVAALATNPDDPESLARWAAVLSRLLARGIVTYRERVDEVRLWEGAHHDVAELVRRRTEADARPVSELLMEAVPLAPMIAQRVSYRTGTLRVFERRYAAPERGEQPFACARQGSDGLLLLWLNESPPADCPPTTEDGRPVVVITSVLAGVLAPLAREAAALTLLAHDATLQNDGVARREVRQRLVIIRQALEAAVGRVFDPASGARVWRGGTEVRIGSLGAALSEAIEETFPHAPVLWNELVHRRELTSQSAKARTRVVAALLSNPGLPALGLQGQGPEVTIYQSVLRRTGIHQPTGDGWIVGPPTEPGLQSLWSAIDAYCMAGLDAPRPVQAMFEGLQAPPLGARAGLIPLVFAAVLLHRADEVSLYWRDSFLQELTPEHFDVLIKRPAEFAVRHFPLAGLRLEIFRELETLMATGTRAKQRGRNATVLSVVRPLVRFATQLPEVTRLTAQLEPEARGVRDVLLNVSSPEALLFEDLPRALGFEPFGATSADTQTVETFRRRLLETLRQLQRHYPSILSSSAQLIREAFRTCDPPDAMRVELRARALTLLDKIPEPRMRALIHTLAEADTPYDAWLEAVLLVISDRPADTWTDSVRVAFELQLAELAARFNSVFAIQGAAIAHGLTGFGARHVRLTPPDGVSTEDIVWIEPGAEAHLRATVGEIQQRIAGYSPLQRQAIAALLLEAELKPQTGGAAAEPIPLEKERRHGRA